MSHEKALKTAANIVAAPVNFAGDWHNQLGSTASFVVAGNILTGTYTSAVSGGGTPVSGPISGYINGDLIAFSVNWPSAAITAWVGQLVTDNAVDTIKTLWQMTTNVADADEPTGLWASVYAGADNFVR
jgi:Avidin family